jgi:hypothetical protein
VVFCTAKGTDGVVVAIPTFVPLSVICELPIKFAPSDFGSLLIFISS